MIFLYILTCASANHSDNSTVTEPLEIDEKDFPIELFDPIAALKVANGIKGDTNGDLVSGGEELTVREISRSFRDLFEQIESRTFGHFDPSTLINYGCYGFYFSERPQSKGGHGHPIDEFDEALRLYKNCLSCLRHHLDEPHCLPELISYQVTDDDESCRGLDTRCKSMVCQCDRMLGDELWRIWQLKGLRPDPANVNVLDTARCKGAEEGSKDPSAIPLEKACCGDFPKQVMYRPAKKKCCSGRVRDHC